MNLSKSCNNISINPVNQTFNSMCTSIPNNCLCENENKALCNKYECQTISEKKCLDASSPPNNNYPLFEKNVSVYPPPDQNEQRNECISPLQKCNSCVISDDATATVPLSREITSGLLAQHSHLAGKGQTLWTCS